MGRSNREQAEQNRQRIVEQAAATVRGGGVAAVSIAEIIGGRGNDARRVLQPLRIEGRLDCGGLLIRLRALGAELERECDVSEASGGGRTETPVFLLPRQEAARAGLPDGGARCRASSRERSVERGVSGRRGAVVLDLLRHRARRPGVPVVGEGTGVRIRCDGGREHSFPGDGRQEVVRGSRARSLRGTRGLIRGGCCEQ